MQKLALAFYRRTVLCVARELIGCFLVHECRQGRIIGRINEVEAYDGAIDKACHAYADKRTPRNEPLFAAGGIAHVYCVYGLHHCLNIVTGTNNEPQAVLLRGVELVDGRALAVRNRYGLAEDALTRQQRKALSNGPGKVCQALAVDRSYDGESLVGDRLYICERIGKHRKKPVSITAGKRIGIAYAQEAADFLWRFTG